MKIPTIIIESPTLIRKFSPITLLLHTSVLLLFSHQAGSQTLVRLTGGVNWSGMIERITGVNEGTSHTSSLPSYSFNLEVAGRKEKTVHLGFSAMYYQSCFDWSVKLEGLHYPYGQDVQCQVQWLRFTIFPEFTFGKKVRFLFNVSPYVGFMISSHESGTSWHTASIYGSYETITEPVDGSAKDEFHNVNFGLQETFGAIYYLRPWLGLTFEESGILSMTNANKTTDWGVNVRNASFHLLAGVSFLIPEHQE